MSQIPYLKRFLLSIVPAFLISSALTSCNDDDGIDGPVEMQLWDIVTYEGKGSDGQGSVFTLRQVDDSPLVTLTSNLGLQDLEAPTRLMIRYIPEGGQAYVSDRIQLLGASKINTGEAATEWKEDYDKWNRDKVFLYSAWRTGTYINFHLRLTYSNNPRIFNLVLDPATRESETPEFYLVHIMAEETDYHDRAYLASFDIGEIWNAPGIKGVKIHIADTNLNKDVFAFYKNN